MKIFIILTESYLTTSLVVGVGWNGYSLTPTYRDLPPEHPGKSGSDCIIDIGKLCTNQPRDLITASSYCISLVYLRSV